MKDRPSMRRAAFESPASVLCGRRQRLPHTHMSKSIDDAAGVIALEGGDAAKTKQVHETVGAAPERRQVRRLCLLGGVVGAALGRSQRRRRTDEGAGTGFGGLASGAATTLPRVLTTAQSREWLKHLARQLAPGRAPPGGRAHHGGALPACAGARRAAPAQRRGAGPDGPGRRPVSSSARPVFVKAGC